MKLKVFFLSLILFIFSVSTSFAILFDLDGLGGQGTVIDFDVFDWTPGSALLHDIDLTPNDRFTVYAHASLSSFTKDGSSLSLPPGYILNQDFEITLVMGFGEKIYYYDSTSQLAKFKFDSSNPTNFFKIYLDYSPDASPLYGTGYNNYSNLNIIDNDATVIASGIITNSEGHFVLSSTSPAILDQTQNGDQWNGQKTVTGSGHTDLSAFSNTVQFNRNYFIQIPTNYYLTYSDGNDNVLPFKKVDPSQSFWDGASFMTPTLGPVNGLPILGGKDIIIQTDGSTSVNVVPEPATMFLLGSGLIGFVGIGRRKFKRNKA